MKRCVIAGGAEIKNYALIREYLRDDDYFIYCDCGLNHKDSLLHEPDLIIGDFDSHSKPDDLNNVIVLPVVKDDTDTIYAVKEGIRLGFIEFILIGVTGGRIDHTLANIYALMMLKESGKSAVILDDYSEMSIISAGERVNIKWGCKFFSLINISGIARGINITGAKYNLTDGEIKSSYQYGVSNEVLSPEHDAQISLREGSLLLVVIRKNFSE
ncbi:MAG: thiamine diphosphokinase [Synergistaceae bacterium]|nr:thiamine diphosphokinase [Synergistaceae bacterium]